MRPYVVALTLLIGVATHGGEVKQMVDKGSGVKVYTLAQGDVVAEVAPDAGFNVFSIKYKGRELLKQPASLDKLPGYMYGVPLLYPMPNRVRHGKLKLADLDLSFEPNNGAHFLHGLVHSAPFQVDGVEQTEDAAQITGIINFKRESVWHKRFPLDHRLLIKLRVTDRAVRWTYELDNSNGNSAIPYGFGLHPWFLYQGTRKKTILTVPATHWMEAVELMPTGKLVDLNGTKFDARNGISLQDFIIDDVYFGLEPNDPARIDFEDVGLQIRLNASKEFTHMVVYTPDKEPFFCVENQTCSTDAHNLYERGLKRESHLLICKPHSIETGWAEFEFQQK